MKYYIEPRGKSVFRPVTLKLTIETKQELDALAKMLGESTIPASFDPLWEAVENLRDYA